MSASAADTSGRHRVASQSRASAETGDVALTRTRRVCLVLALCNADWVHDDGTEWAGSWRHAAGVVAELRGRGEDYLDFYCSPSGAEGTISERVGAAMAALGWHGTGHGAPLRLVDPATGESKVFVDGDWIDADEFES